MKTLTNVKNSHSKTMVEAEAYLELLDLAKSTDADTLRNRIRQSIDQTAATLLYASDFKTRVAALKSEAVAATEDLKLFIGGSYAVIQPTNPKLYAKLPRRETWTAMAPTEQAQHFSDALHAAGKEAQVYAEQLDAVAKRRLRAMQAWIEAGNAKLTAHGAQNSVAELKLLLAEADVLLHKLATPGSVMEGLLKKARGGKRKSKGGNPTGVTLTPQQKADAAKAKIDQGLARSLDALAKKEAKAAAKVAKAAAKAAQKQVAPTPATIPVPVPVPTMNGAYLNGSIHS